MKNIKMHINAALMALVILFCGVVSAADITTDTTINTDNFSTYEKEALNVSSGVTLTIELAPETDKTLTFTGAVSGEGTISVNNTGAGGVYFSGSFESFTGKMTATGDVRVRNVWADMKLNGSLTGVLVEGAAARTVTFYKNEVLLDGSAVKIGWGTTPSSTLNLAKYTQTISDITLVSCAYQESHTSYKKPGYVFKGDEGSVLSITNSMVWGNGFPSDKSGSVCINGALTFVYACNAGSSFAFHGESTTSGGLSVTNGEIEIASDATFNNLTTLSVIKAGKINVKTTAINPDGLTMEIADEGTITLSESEKYVVNMLKVAGAYVAPDDYTADEIATLTQNRLTGAAVSVTTRPVNEIKTYTWTGSGADNSVSTKENWDGNEAPELKEGNEILVFATGESATFPSSADIYGLKITAGNNFTLKSDSEDSLLRIGAGGLTNETSATTGVSTNKFEIAVRVAGTQTWAFNANSVVELNSGWSGHSAVTLTRTGTAGDILIFSSDETSKFAGTLTVPDGNILVCTGRGGIGGEGSLVTLNTAAGIRTEASSVTNCAALIYGKGANMSLAPAGKTFVQLGAMTNAANGANSPYILVAGTLYVNGGISEVAAHLNNPSSYRSVSTGFQVAKGGALWIKDQPIQEGGCNLRLNAQTVNSIGDVHLSAQNNTWGALALINGIGVICEAENVLAESGDIGFFYNYSGSLDLNGYSQVAKDAYCANYDGTSCLTYAGDSKMIVKSEEPATLKLTGSGNYNAFNLNFQGEASLHYAGEGKLAMTNTASTTVGSLTVSSGKVALLKGATWANCTNVVISGTGKLTLDTDVASATPFSTDGTLAVSDSGKIEIPEGKVVTVKYLWRNGEGTFAGSYTADFITGGGTLKVKKSTKKVGLMLIVR